MNYPKMMCSKNSSAERLVGVVGKGAGWPGEARRSLVPKHTTSTWCPLKKPPLNTPTALVGHGAPVATKVKHATTIYRIMHFFFFAFSRLSSAARVACSNTSRTPSFVFAEHSRYFWAWIFLRTSSACRVRR